MTTPPAPSQARARAQAMRQQYVDEHDVAPAAGAEQSAGLLHHLWGWCEAMLHYGLLRGQLALTEAKAAGSHYGGVAALFAAALIVAMYAYLFLIITVVFAISAWIDTEHAWLMVMGGAAGLHLILAVILVLLATSRLKTGIFEKTKEEFRKDNLWPKTPTPEAPTN